MSEDHILELTSDLAFDFLEETHNLQTKAIVSWEIDLPQNLVIMLIVIVNDNTKLLRTEHYLQHVYDINNSGLFLDLLQNKFPKSDL